jgi:hypothetical protein
MKQPQHTAFAKLAEKALIRASARARALSEQTGTPFVVSENGKIVDSNPRRAAPRKAG